MIIYFEIHFNHKENEYTIENVGNSNRKIQIPNSGFLVDYLGTEHEAYRVHADINFEGDPNIEIHKIVNEVTKGHLRSRKIKKIKDHVNR